MDRHLSLETESPTDHHAPPAVLPLVCDDSLRRIEDALRAFGDGELEASLFADARRYAAYLERCFEAASAVLRGDLPAATRLWLLLREPVAAGFSIPRSVAAEIAGDSAKDAAQIVNRRELLLLIAGVVRAANQPAEADAMLRAMERLLEPLFLVELAASASERARRGERAPLATFEIAIRAARDRKTLEGFPILELGPFGPILEPDDRVKFEEESWGKAQPGSVFISEGLRGWDCAGGVRKEMSQIDRFGGRYTIESLSNPAACPGQTIIIFGENFGAEGRVYFPSPNAGDPAFALGSGDDGILGGVKAALWTDTQIKVVVPPWATMGELHLNAFKQHRSRCLAVDVYRLGNKILFEGGLAAIYKVFISGREIEPGERPNLTPGDRVNLSWVASSGPSVRIKVQLEETTLGGIISAEAKDLPGGFGGLALQVPREPQQPRPATLIFTATSICPGAVQPLRIPVFLAVRPRLGISFIEVTQGVQTRADEVRAGNFMPTVAYKDTAVRVHMFCDRGGWYGNRLDQITGVLLVDGRPLPPTNVRKMIPADQGFARIKGFSDANVTNDTLNFTIPAEWLTPGAHALGVRLVCDDPTGKIEVVQAMSWSWAEKTPMPVRVVKMGLYPNREAMLDFARQALDFLPTPLTDIGVAGPEWFSHNHDLTTDEGWNDLLDDLEDEWDEWDEASGVRWLGIIPASERMPALKNPDGTPKIQLAAAGLSGTPSIAVLAMGDLPRSAAHELAHSYNLHHVALWNGAKEPEGEIDIVDNGGRLRRPPFDVRPSTAVPLPAGDLMSYFEPVRPGITTWMRLFNISF